MIPDGDRHYFADPGCIVDEVNAVTVRDNEVVGVFVLLDQIGEFE